MPGCLTSWSPASNTLMGEFSSVSPEAQINRRSYGIEADAETKLRHHEHMRDRIYRILSVKDDAALELKSKLLQLDRQIALLKEK